LKHLRIQKEIAQADMAQRIGLSRSTLNTLENTGKGSVTSWIKWVQCLGQEAQLQALFKPVIVSIADMAKQQKPARQRVTPKRLRPEGSP
jgi:DNA-binding XRE family transcriptional regulator